nr:RNA-directed DNA polymerase, eukaryota [Tanacetum cinerariifolium]
EEEDDVSVEDNHGGIHSDQDINNCNDVSDVEEVPQTCFNVPEGIKLMIVVVYAPQETSEKLDGFDKLVRDTWNDAPGNKKNAIRNFLYKLKYTKEKIRGWLSTYRLNSRGALAKLKEDLRMFDEAIDKGNSPVEMVHKRLETLNKIQQTGAD